MQTHAVLSQAVPAATCQHLLKALRATGYLGKSQLRGAFGETRGFGAAFTLAGRHDLETEIPALRPFLDVVIAYGRGHPLASSSRKTLQGWSKRLGLGGGKPPNAFYVNLLSLEDGCGVGPHIDGTVGGLVDQAHLTPEFVTVLYLAVPQGAGGGELELDFANGCTPALLPPHQGDLVTFRGDLRHSVRQLVGASQARVSMVCEQYILDEDTLAQAPRCRVQSFAPGAVYAAGPRRELSFAEHLAHRRDGKMH